MEREREDAGCPPRCIRTASDGKTHRAPTFTMSLSHATARKASFAWAHALMMLA